MNKYSVLKNEKILYINPNDSEHLLISKKINDNEWYICEINKQIMFTYKKKYIAKISNLEEEKEITDLFKNYIVEHEKYKDISFLGQYSKNDYMIDIKKEGKKLSIELYKDNNLLGCRDMEFSPFECYYRLGIYTICGNSDIFEKDCLGKGYGKALYDIIDNVIHYQQIPHGYQGAPFSLSQYSDNFWKKRSLFKVIPEPLENRTQNDDILKNINQTFHNYYYYNSGFYNDNHIYMYFLSQIPSKILRLNNFFVLSNQYDICSFHESEFVQEISREDFKAYILEEQCNKIKNKLERKNELEDRKIQYLLSVFNEKVEKCIEKLKEKYPLVNFNNDLILEEKDIIEENYKNPFCCH